MEPVSISLACGLAGALWGIQFGRRRSRLVPMAACSSPRIEHAVCRGRSSLGTGDDLTPLDGLGLGPTVDLDNLFAEFLAADPHEQPARRWLLGT